VSERERLVLVRVSEMIRRGRTAWEGVRGVVFGCWCCEECRSKGGHGDEARVRVLRERERSRERLCSNEYSSLSRARKETKRKEKRKKYHSCRKREVLLSVW